jgi:hypothetical protein
MFKKRIRKGTFGRPPKLLAASISKSENNNFIKLVPRISINLSSRFGSLT